MLELILKLYTMSMAVDIRSPLPHLVGPPGCGKSTVVEEAAEIIGCNVHVLNVSRLSPLEIEGVQMPHTEQEEMKLRLLTATIWTQLEEGDILLLDEFLRAFPEVYNGLLDILTGRKVAHFKLPKVFIIAASNSTVAYDKALEDRLLHLPVPDPRGTDKEGKKAKKHLAKLVVDKLGLMPEMTASAEMSSLLDTEVLPMFKILDSFNGKGNTGPTTLEGSSIRKLIGQAQLRQVQSQGLAELIKENNRKAMAAGKPQYVFLVEARDNTALPAYEAKAKSLVGNARLTEIQALNLELNLQLIELERIRHEKGTVTEDDNFIDDLLD
jgi:hypothetical protein